MNLNSIFAKPIDRAIEGVIKANDSASLKLELEEYVLTGEIEKRLERFLDAYNNYENANGVWISGFFGSGKSHLLKMLALVLEDQQVEGVSAKDIFLSKCSDNEILSADLKKAAGTPSKSILFNIDQKADTIHKGQLDALLAVFVKVFNEMCGYYGKTAHIAQFERDLDGRDLFQPFQDAFQSLASIPWERGREQALLEASNIAKAYAQVTGDDESVAQGILDKYRSDYSLSIGDFAGLVDDYVRKQEKGFRLNFFVDEVGQYIADNVKLMTNLQTIAESLATKSRGQAWIIVTAQEDMSTVVGDMNQRQANDFSKIQARFANRMKLTSQDVAEVIQKRLLTKNDTGIEALSDIHHEQHNNFKTLFDFADGSISYRNYSDRDHFIHCYPFIPYHFTLFQSAIQNLSEHNAFEGKHSSVGERSMLGVFQLVATQIGDHQLGQLATFDLMFEGVRTALKASIQSAILKAEKHLEHPFAIRLLKALFLVKYVKEFKPTVRNLCILMLESFDTNHANHQKSVEEALNILEQQTYIQRNGPHYEYLTNEEKDVEEEIKSTEVDTQDIAEELQKILFDNVIRNRKIRFEENKQDFSYTRKLDDKHYGREYELCIHVITPFHEHSGNDKIIQSQNMGRDELLIHLPSDDVVMRDITLYKQTEKYIGQNFSLTQSESVKRILTDRRSQNQQRLSNIEDKLKQQLVDAKLFIAGTQVDISSSDAMSRVMKAFNDLVAKTYPNLKQLRGVNYTETLIPDCLNASTDGLFANDGASLTEPEQEIISFIQRNKNQQVRTPLKLLIDTFESKPYGWPYPAILCQLAYLCARAKVELRIDSQILDDTEIEKALRNTTTQAQVIIEPQIDFTPSQVRGLKDFYQDFFQQPPAANEAKAMAQATAAAVRDQVEQLKSLLTQQAHYPFLSQLTPAIETLEPLVAEPYTWYLTELRKQSDDLLDLMELTISPILKFMAGTQKAIFDEARDYLRHQAPNFSYLDTTLPEEIETDLASSNIFQGQAPQQLKAKLTELQAATHKRVQTEATTATQTVTELEQRLTGMDEFSELDSAQKQSLTTPFETLRTNLNGQQLIAVIRDTLRNFEETRYQQLLTQMTTWAEPEHDPFPTSLVKEPSVNDADPPTRPKTQIEYITLRSLKPSFSKAWLETETDVDSYLEALRTTMLSEINQDKRIQI